MLIYLLKESGNLGLHQSYFRGAAVWKDGPFSLEIAKQYSEQFFNYLQSSEASTAGITVGKDAKVFVIAGEGSTAFAQGSTYGPNAKGMIMAEKGGKSYSQNVAVAEGARIQTVSGSKGAANTNKAQVGERATLAVLANADSKTLERTKRQAEEDFWS